MNNLIFYPVDCHFNIILEYLYDEYPDKINNFVYTNECSMDRYEYRFRRFKDKQSVKSILPHDCDITFMKELDDTEVEFHCKLEVINIGGIPEDYYHNLAHEGGEDRVLKKLVLSSVIPIINYELTRLLDEVCDFEIELEMNDKNEVDFNIIKNNITKK